MSTISLLNSLTSNPLPAFIQFQAIDRRPAPSLTCSMRWTPLLALATFVLAVPAAAQTTNAPPKLVKTPTQLARVKAEPENAQQYGAPVHFPGEGPSEADVGAPQRHFVRASGTDNLAETQNADNASLAIHEKIALDNKISVPKIHDVQNDGPYSNNGAGNHALQFETAYLNWGAVTEEQINARKGHYFTITWKNKGPKADFTTKFEYREVKSKEIVRTLTQKMPAVSGAARSYFAVVDKAYLTYGPVVAWRFTVFKGDTVVAEAKSFIW
jgi:hypothetical protein